MKLKVHLQVEDKPQPVGKESFKTFVKVAEQVSTYALDELSLAATGDQYKVFVCWVPFDQIDKLNTLMDRYDSMQLAKLWLDKVFIAGIRRGLYYALKRVGSRWEMSYGLTDGNNLYLVGKFAYNSQFEMPDSTVTKHFKYYYIPFDPRVHALLDVVRKDLKMFEPGPCTIQEPQVAGTSVVLSCHMLGYFTQDQGGLEWVEGEAERHLKTFQTWVKDKPWWKIVKLAIRPSHDGWCDFVVYPKIYGVDINK
jgi:hypothetical protein